MRLLPGSHSSQSAQRGSTLLLSLLATIVVVSLSAVFLQLTSSIAKRQSQAADQKRSFYLAEAGLAEAFAGLRSGKSGDIGSETDPALYGNGLFWVEATELGNDLVSLESTGMCGSTMSQLDLVAMKGAASVAALGVFSAGDLTISSGSSLTSFDSDPLAGGGSASGGSGSQQLLQQQQQQQQAITTELVGRIELTRDIGTEGVARVSTNGNIVISQNLGQTTQVLGDLRPGIAGSITKNGAPVISGSEAPLTTPVKLVPVDVPAYVQNPGYIHNKVQPFVVPPIKGSYQFLGVRPGTEITFSGPSVIVLEQLVIEPGAQVTFDTESGPIQIFITDKLDFQAGSNLTVTSASALDLSILVSGTLPAELRSTCDFQGTLYAPSAEMIVQQEFRVFGSIVANQLTLEGACELSFDAALGRAAELDALPVLVSWRIVELDPNAAPSGDPFAELGVIRSTMKPPSESHKDQLLAISYIDAGGVEQTYNGFESAFPWTSVTQVLNLTRDGISTGQIEGLAGIGGTGGGTGQVTSGLKGSGGARTPARTALLTSL